MSSLFLMVGGMVMIICSALNMIWMNWNAAP